MARNRQETGAAGARLTPSQRHQLAELYTSSQRRVGAALNTMVGPNKVDDLASESLLNMVGSFARTGDSVCTDTGASYWLRCAMTILYDEDHRNKTLQPESIQAKRAKNSSFDIPAPQPMRASPYTAQVEEALSRIKPEYRALLEMRHVQELEHKAIASDLHIWESGERAKLKRAEQAFREALAEVGITEETFTRR